MRSEHWFRGGWGNKRSFSELIFIKLFSISFKNTKSKKKKARLDAMGINLQVFILWKFGLKTAKFGHFNSKLKALTHWARVTHKCVCKLTSIGSDNGLSPDRHQAIIWTNAGVLLVGPLGTNCSAILIAIHTFSFIQENAFENDVWKMASILSPPQCVKNNLALNRWQVITGTNYESALWHICITRPQWVNNDAICASLGLSELIMMTYVTYVIKLTHWGLVMHICHHY